MSQNDGARSAITLEEALAELEGLKEQLSGSDLKVFTQNRELRQETTKLREEVTRLAEECVTQTFTIRTLEKAKAGLEEVKARLEQEKAELEKNKAELESQVANLTAHVAELENRVADLTEEVGVHRSQEIHLSQELERTISANAEEVARLRTEHDSMLNTTRENLEKAKAELEQELTGKLQAREVEIETLERRVELFKEEFLSQEVASPIVSLPPAIEQGKAFKLLRDKMEGLLGFPGKAMVEQVFRLCGADEATSDPAVLEEAFEALQDTAAKLVRSPEQEQELSDLLGQAWNELGLDGRQFHAPSMPAVSPVESPAEELTPSAHLAEEESKESSVPVDSTSETSEPAEPPSPESEPQTSSDAPSEERTSSEAASREEPAVGSAEVSDRSQSGTEASPTDSAETELQPEAQDSSESSSESPAPEEQSVSEAPSEVEESSLAEEEPVAGEESRSSEADPSGPDPLEDAASQTSDSEESSQEASSELGEVTEEVAASEPDSAVVEQESSEEDAFVEPSIDAPLETSVEASLLDTEAVTEEDRPAVTEPVEPSQEPILDSIEEALAADETSEPSQEEASDSEPAADQPEATEVQPEPVAAESQEAAAAGQGGFEEASAALLAGDYETALPLFERLRAEQPDEAAYQVGEVSALAGLERYDEAYALGRTMSVDSLGDSQDHFLETFEAVLVGRVELAETLVARKLALIELVDFVRDPDRVRAYLDEVDEIPLRTPSEGRLSLKQAQARVEHDDVTDYLIEAMQSLSDRYEVFDLLRQNLDRYPELAPLSDLTDRLLNSSRDESIEAEGPAQSLLVGDETLEDLLNEADPGEEALIQVFLEHLLPRTGLKMELPSETFEDLLADSEPAAFVGALRQALRSVDYTLFFDEIEVLSYDGEEHFLLRSSPEPKATLLFGSDVDDVPPEELRFLVLRELFSMNRRHSHLAHLSAQLDDHLRYAFVKACLEIHQEAEFLISDELLAQLGELEGMAQTGAQDPDFKVKLEQALLSVYQATESDSFMELADFLYDGQLHKKWLDPLADSFAAKQTGIVVASFAIARDVMEAEDFEAVEEAGFGWLYQSENLDKYSELRLRLQRLWSMPFKALVADAEE